MSNLIHPIFIFPGYVVNTTKPHRVIYDPTNPAAAWCVVMRRSGVSQLSLAREQEDGSWEVLYDVRNKPLTIDEILGAKIKLESCWYGGILVDLLRNKPRKFHHTTTVVAARPDEFCCKCQRPAEVTLSSYNNGNTTSCLMRHFCQDCLRDGEVPDKKRICHICRENRADLTVYAEGRGSNFHEFRVHRHCVENLRSHIRPRPTLDERRPLRRTILQPKEVT